MNVVIALNKLINPLRARIMSLIGKAIVEAVNDTTGLQTLKITLLADEVRSTVERVQDYGLSAYPPKGADAVYAAIGGMKDNVVIIKVDSAEFRIKNLEEGEVALYTKWCGQSREHCIILKKDKSIEIRGEKIKITGDLEVTGKIEASGTVKGSDLIAGSLSMSSHVHVATTLGSPTSGPQSPPPAP